MLIAIAFFAAGYFFGTALRETVFSKQNGAGWLTAAVIALASFCVAAVGVSVFAQLKLGVTGTPIWAGSLVGPFTIAVFFGVKRRSKKS